MKCHTLEIRALRSFETSAISHPPTPLNNPADLNHQWFSRNISQVCHYILLHSNLNFTVQQSTQPSWNRKFPLSSSHRVTFTKFQTSVIIIIIIIIFYSVHGDLELRWQMITLISIHISHININKVNVQKKHCNIGMRRITTFRSTTDRTYDGGLIIL
jgi:hypothetical protein